MLMPVEFLVAELLDNLRLGQGLHHFEPRCLRRWRSDAYQVSKTGSTEDPAAETGAGRTSLRRAAKSCQICAEAFRQGIIFEALLILSIQWERPYTPMGLAIYTPK